MMLHPKRFHLFVAVAFALNWSLVAFGDGDTQGATPNATSIESLIQGLNDPSYRTRRESFLRLCDRSIPLEAWLEAESKSSDKQRSAIAVWLKRLRRSNGSMSERAGLMQDFEVLRASSDLVSNKTAVLDRYMVEGRWEGLLELITLLEPAVRTELLREDGRLQSIVQKAWKSDNEAIVPRLLDLVLMPTERVQANRLWRSLGMPDEWSVSQSATLPSVKVTELEADGKIDEAIVLAEKSSLRNMVEPILIRSNQWDRWLAMDRRRTPITSLGNFNHQRAAILLLLGRTDEANQELDKILEGPEASELSSGSAILSLALGRTAELDAYLEKQPEPTSFHVMRSLGSIHGAFKQVGLEDLSLDSVETWLNSRGYLKRQAANAPSDPERKLKELQLADYADMFFQVGMDAQGKLIDTHLVERMKKTEKAEGATTSAWIPLFRQWLITNDRPKAIFHWKEYLVRNSQSNVKSKAGLPYHTEDEESGPFELLYSAFPYSAPMIFEHLFSIAMEAEQQRQGDDVPITADLQRVNSIGLAINQMEDLQAGRIPTQWDGRRSMLALRSAVHLKSIQVELSGIGLVELASLFDILGETELAIETLDMGSANSIANQSKADYLVRIGKLDDACNLYVDEFQKSPSDVGLLIKCTETLGRVGRIHEMDRFRIQGLSSLSNSRFSMTMPPNKLAVQLAEQNWRRNKIEETVITLSRQYSELAKTELSLAQSAAQYARVEILMRVKNQWLNDGVEIDASLSLFGNAFQALILEAISKNDRDLANKLIRVAFRCKPQDIDVPIVVVPEAERVFGKELADEWFDLYYRPLLRHLGEFPNDSLIGNNTAWLAASCNRHLEKAKSIASNVVVSHPDATYLDTLAEIEYRLGNVESAIALSTRCLQMEPKNKQHRKQLKRFRAGNP